MWNNPLPHTEAFRCLCSRRLLKTLWQKDKLFMMSNFSFSTMFSTLFHNCHFIYRVSIHLTKCLQSVFCIYVFKSRLLQRHHKASTWEKGIENTDRVFQMSIDQSMINLYFLLLYIYLFATNNILTIIIEWRWLHCYERRFRNNEEY